ncbi:MAG TPA: glycosyltransferase, partial [Candidatus Saccharimonadia bacterium]|nr:glycosyltransferase [Candidatus Saccharimonadia bacterium]
MKVLHVIKLDPRAAGGIERFADELMSAQVAAGLDVHAVGCDVPATPALPPRPYGLELARTWFTVFHLPFAPRFPAIVRREVARLAPDIVHLHWPNPLVLDMAAAVPASTRLVIHWQADIDPTAASLPIRAGYAVAVRRFESRLLARSDAVIASSRAYFDASPVLRAVAERVRVIPLGIGDPGAPADPATWPLEGGPRILFVGRAVPYKSLEVLLAALARLPVATLAVVGSGPQIATWRATAQRLGVSRRVAWLGNVDEATKRALFAACDVVCLPSSNRLESFGVVMLEAAAAGRPVVAADIPGSGVPEIARAVGGTTFPVGDAEALAACLASASTAFNARSALPAQFRIESIERAIARVYDDVTTRAPDST